MTSGVKISGIPVALAAVLVIASCQKELEIPTPDSHTVQFVLSPDQTRTSYSVEGDEVVYSWEYSDLGRIRIYEDGIQGTVNAAYSTVTPDNMRLSVTFAGSPEGGHEYRACLNGYVKSAQNSSIGKYDSDCDVLVAQPVYAASGSSAPVEFRFRRATAIAELILKGLEDAAGEIVSEVVISSDQPLVGTYTQDTSDDLEGSWAYGPGQDNRIVLECNGRIGSDGCLPIYIVSRPLDNASLKLSLRTSSGKIYRKITAPAFSLVAGNVKEQGIRMTKAYEPETRPAGWYIVDSIDDLCDGDEIRIACVGQNTVAGPMESGKNFLSSVTGYFNETGTEILSADGALTFTVEELYDGWAFSCDAGRLGAVDAKNLSFDSGHTGWTIDIDSRSVASIANGERGCIQYNVSAPRFQIYTSSPNANQILPNIFKKHLNPSDPDPLPTSASFNPESASVTIGASGNVFPVLTTSSLGVQHWGSSNPEVATVDGNGAVTILSEGFTTITVNIDGYGLYLPCSASYELVVNAAGPEESCAWLELPAISGTEDFVGTFRTADGRNYSYYYDYGTYTSLWVAYPLYSSTTGGSRDGKWARNPELPDNRQINVWSSSYGVEYVSGNSYARGHQIPDADRSNNAGMQAQTYYATNSTPQIQNGFNGGIWSSLEGAVRGAIPEKDTVYVATGAVFRTVGGSETITWIQPKSDTKQVPVPNYYWKALLKVKRDSNGRPGSASAIGFWFEHRVYSNDSYTNHTVSVDQIESLTGFDLFANLPSSEAAAAEANTSWTSFTSF